MSILGIPRNNNCVRCGNDMGSLWILCPTCWHKYKPVTDILEFFIKKRIVFNKHNTDDKYEKQFIDRWIDFI